MQTAISIQTQPTDPARLAAVLHPDFPPTYLWPTHPTLRDVFNFYLNDPTRRRSKTSDYAVGHIVDLVEAVFGDDMPVAALGRAACRQFLEMLRWVPANFARRLPGFSLAEAVALSQRGNRRSTLKPIAFSVEWIGTIRSLRPVLIRLSSPPSAEKGVITKQSIPCRD